MKEELRRESLIVVPLLCAFAAYLTVGCMHHEAWRDEWQAINIARSFTSLPDLYARLRYEGHPPLWFLAVRAAWDIHPALISVQILNGLFAVSAAGLVAFLAPWPLWLRLLAAFSGPAAWEYSIKARGYGLGWLLVVCLALILRRSEGRWKSWVTVVLTVLCLNTSVFTGIVAFSLMAGWLWELVRHKQLQRNLLPLAMLCAATAGTFLLARPPLDSNIGLAPEKIVNGGIGALSTLFAVTLIPCDGLDWAYLPYLTAFAVAVVFSCFRDLCASAPSRVALASGWSVCMLFVVYKSGIQPWYLWHVFLLPFAVSIAFEHRSPFPRAAIPVLALLAITGLNGGISEYLHDRVTVYSAAGPAAAGIQSSDLADLPVVVFPNYFRASLSGYLGRPIYEGSCEAPGTYVLFFNRRAGELESFECAIDLAHGTPQKQSIFTTPEPFSASIVTELSTVYGVNLSLVGSYMADAGTDYRFGTNEHFNVYLLTVNP